MSTPNVQDDIAFMKSLVADGGRFQMSGGWAFIAGGLLYGGECLFHWFQYQGWVQLGDGGTLALIIFVNVSFLSVLAWGLWRDTKKGGPRGLVGRAINAMFAGVGLANLAMVCVFGFTATREENLLIWLLYPAVVCALQGAAWFVAYMLRKHVWLLAVALGWYATAIWLGFVIGTPTYVLVLGVALILLMALPGFALVRLAKRQG